MPEAGSRVFTTPPSPRGLEAVGAEGVGADLGVGATSLSLSLSLSLSIYLSTYLSIYLSIYLSTPNP